MWTYSEFIQISKFCTRKKIWRLKYACRRDMGRQGRWGSVIWIKSHYNFCVMQLDWLNELNARFHQYLWQHGSLFTVFTSESSKIGNFRVVRCTCKWFNMLFSYSSQSFSDLRQLTAHKLKIWRSISETLFLWNRMKKKNVWSSFQFGIIASTLGKLTFVLLQFSYSYSCFIWRLMSKNRIKNELNCSIFGRDSSMQLLVSSIDRTIVIFIRSYEHLPTLSLDYKKITLLVKNSLISHYSFFFYHAFIFVYSIRLSMTLYWMYEVLSRNKTNGSEKSIVPLIEKYF